MTHIVITGQAKTKGNPHDSTQLTFSASITVSGQKDRNEQFSIVVTDSSGKVVYQKSGTAKGHVEFNKHKAKTDSEDKNEQKGNDNENDQNDNDEKNDHKNMTKISLTTNETIHHKNNGKNDHKNNKKDD
jgi:hypothetical protein